MDGEQRRASASASPSPPAAAAPAVLKSQSRAQDAGVMPADASSSLLPPPMSGVTSSPSVDSVPPPPAAVPFERSHSAASPADVANDLLRRQESGDTGDSADSGVMGDDAVRSHEADSGRAQLMTTAQQSASAAAAASTAMLAAELATSLPALEPPQPHSVDAMDTNSSRPADSAHTGSDAASSGDASAVDDSRSGWFALCEILLKKGPKYAGKCLAERTERSVRDGQRLLSYFLKHFFLKAQSCQLGNICVSDWCLHILVGGDTPSAFLKLFRARVATGGIAGAGAGPVPPSVCGRYLAEGDFVYSCRTCAMGPSNVVCPGCFHDGGRHEGHDYVLQVTAGGTCDCGDSGWKSSGVCATHTHNRAIEVQLQAARAHREESARLSGSAEYIETVALRFRMRVLLFSVVSYVCSSIHSLGAYPAAHRRFASVVKVLSWTRKLAKSSSQGSGSNELTDALAMALCAPFDTHISTAVFPSEFLNERLLARPTHSPPSTAAAAGSSSGMPPISRLHFLLHHCCMPLPHFAPSRLDRIMSELCYTLLTHADFKRAMTFALLSANVQQASQAVPYTLYRRMLIAQCRLPSVVHSLFMGGAAMEPIVVQQRAVPEALRLLRDVLIGAVHMGANDLPVVSHHSMSLHAMEEKETERKVDEERRGGAAAGVGNNTDALLSPRHRALQTEGPTHVHWADADQQRDAESRRALGEQLLQQLAHLRAQAVETFAAVQVSQLTGTDPRVAAVTAAREQFFNGGPVALPGVSYAAAAVQNGASSSVSPTAGHAVPPASSSPNFAAASSPNGARAPSPLFPPLASPSSSAASDAAALAAALYGQALPEHWQSTALVPTPRVPDGSSSSTAEPRAETPPPSQAAPAVWFYNRQHSLSYVLSHMGYTSRVSSWNERCAAVLARAAPQSPGVQRLLRLQSSLHLPLQALVLDASHPLVSNHVFLQLKNDLMTLLEHTAACQDALFSPETVQLFLSLLLLFQHFNPHTRKLGTHVDYEKSETETKNYFYLEMLMHKFVERCINKGKLLPPPEQEEEQDQQRAQEDEDEEAEEADERKQHDGSLAVAKKKHLQPRRPHLRVADVPPSPYTSLHARCLLPVGPASASGHDSSLPPSLGMPGVSSPSIPLRSPYHAQNQLRLLQLQREMVLRQQAEGGAAGAIDGAVVAELDQQTQQAERAVRNANLGNNRAHVALRIMQSPSSPVAASSSPAHSASPALTLDHPFSPMQQPAAALDLAQLVARPLPPSHSCVRCAPHPRALTPKHVGQIRALLHSQANHLLFDFHAQGLPITEAGLVLPRDDLSSSVVRLRPLPFRVLTAALSVHQPLQRIFTRTLVHVLTYFGEHIRAKGHTGFDDFLLFDAQDSVAASASASAALPPDAHLSHVHSTALSFWLCFLEAPLRVTVFLSQLRTKSLWIRNGFDTISFLQKNYKNTCNFWRRGFGNDLASMQVAGVRVVTLVDAQVAEARAKGPATAAAAAASSSAAAASSSTQQQQVDGAELLMQRLVERWDASWWLQSGDSSSWTVASLPAQPSPYSSAETLTLAEDLLKLVHALVCDRSFYVCDRDLLRCFVIHVLLAYGDQITHSQVVQFLPHEAASEAAAVVDEVLAEVAQFIPPPSAPSQSSAARCGVYQLRPRYWSYAISPCMYWKYTHHEMVIAEEKWRAGRAKAKEEQRKRGVLARVVAPQRFLEPQDALSMAQAIGAKHAPPAAASASATTSASASASDPLDGASEPVVTPVNVPAFFEPLLGLLHAPTLHSVMFTLLSLAVAGMDAPTKADQAAQAAQAQAQAHAQARTSDPSFSVPPILFSLAQSNALGGGHHNPSSFRMLPRSMTPGPDLPLDRMMAQVLHLLLLGLTYPPGWGCAQARGESAWPRGFRLQPSCTHLAPLVWDGNSVPAATDGAETLPAFASHPSRARLVSLVSLVEQLLSRGHMAEFAHEMRSVLLLAQARLGRPMGRSAVTQTGSVTPEGIGGADKQSASSSPLAAGPACSSGAHCDARALAKLKAKQRQAKLMARISNEQHSAARKHGLALEPPAAQANARKKRRNNQSAAAAEARPAAEDAIMADNAAVATTPTFSPDLSASPSPSATASPMDSPPSSAAAAASMPPFSPLTKTTSSSAAAAAASSSFDQARCCLCHEGADAGKFAGTDASSAGGADAADASAAQPLFDPRVGQVLGSVCFLTPTSLNAVAHRTFYQQLAQRMAAQMSQQQASADPSSPRHAQAQSHPNRAGGAALSQQSYQSSHPSFPAHHNLSAEAFAKQPLGALAPFKSVAQQIVPEAFLGSGPAAAAAVMKRVQTERLRRPLMQQAAASSLSAASAAGAAAGNSNLAPPTLFRSYATPAPVEQPTHSLAPAITVTPAAAATDNNEPAVATAAAAAAAASSPNASPAAGPAVAPAAPASNSLLAIPSINRSTSAPFVPVSLGGGEYGGPDSRRSPPTSSSTSSSSSSGPAGGHPHITFDWCHSLGLHLQPCTHSMHIGCLETYLTTKYGRSGSGSGAGAGWRQGAPFLCPACRRLSNVIIPVGMETSSELMPPPLQLCAPTVAPSMTPSPSLSLKPSLSTAPAAQWRELESWVSWAHQTMQRPAAARSPGLAVLASLSSVTARSNFAPPSAAFMGVIKHFIHIVSYMLRGHSSIDAGASGTAGPNAARVQAAEARRARRALEARYRAVYQLPVSALENGTQAPTLAATGAARTNAPAVSPSVSPTPPAAAPVPEPTPMTRSRSLWDAQPVLRGAAAGALPNSLATASLLNQATAAAAAALAAPSSSSAAAAVSSTAVVVPQFSASSIAAYMRIFLCIAGNTCSIWELSIRQQCHSVAPECARSFPALGDDLASSSVFSFAPMLPALLSSHALSARDFYASIPQALENRQHKIFGQLLVLYRLTRQQWLSVSETNANANASVAAVQSVPMDVECGSASAASASGRSAGLTDSLEDILFLWQMMVGDARDDAEDGAGASGGMDGTSHTDDMHAAATVAQTAAAGLTLPLLSRNMFSVLVQLTPVFLRLCTVDGTSASSIPAGWPASDSSVASSASGATLTAEQHTLGVLRTLYLATIAQSVAYVSSLGMYEHDHDKDKTASSDDALANGNGSGTHKRKASGPPMDESAAASCAASAAAASSAGGSVHKKVKMERGVTVPLSFFAEADDTVDMSDAAAAAPAGLHVQLDGATARAQLWQSAADQLGARLQFASPHELLLSTACIVDVTSLPSLLLFARALRMRLIDLTMPFHLHVAQQQERQAALREDGRCGGAHWTSLCEPLGDQPVAQALEQMCTPFVRQAALFLSSIFHVDPATAATGSSAHPSPRPLLDFASIFPSLVEGSWAGSFLLGPHGQRLLWQWYQALFLPVWAKRAMAAGANQGRTTTRTNWPQSSQSAASAAAASSSTALSLSLHDHASPSMLSLSPPPLISSTSPELHLLSPSRQPQRLSPSQFGLVSPPRLSNAVPHASASVSAPNAAAQQQQQLMAAASSNSGASAAAAGSSAAGGAAARWTLATFTPFQTTAAGGSGAGAGSSGASANASQMRALAAPLSLTPTSSPTPHSLQLVPSRPTGPPLPPFPCVGGDVGDKFSLCGLPPAFHTFLSSAALRTCVQCRSRRYSCHNKAGAENLAVCLLCGSFVCLGNGSGNGSGGASNKCYLQHLMRCDGRIGLYLLLKRGGEVLCILHSPGGTAACFWPSLYLDAYGESDQTLARGRPLFLHAGRVQALTKQYTGMALQDFISAHAAPIQLGQPQGGAPTNGANPFAARTANAGAAGVAAAAAGAAAAPGSVTPGMMHATVLPASLLASVQQTRRQQRTNTSNNIVFRGVHGGGNMVTLRGEFTFNLQHGPLAPPPLLVPTPLPALAAPPARPTGTFTFRQRVPPQPDQTAAAAAAAAPLPLPLPQLAQPQAGAGAAAPPPAAAAAAAAARDQEAPSDGALDNV